MLKKLVLISSLVLSVALSSGVVYGEEALKFGYDNQVESMLNVAGVLDVEYVSGAGHLGYDSVDYSLDRLQLDNTSYISAVIAKSLGLYGELDSIYDFKSGKLSEYTRDSLDISSAKRGDLLIFNDRIAFYLGDEDGKPMILYAADDVRGVVKEEAPTDIDVIVDTQLYIESGKFKYIGKPEVNAREVRNAVQVDSSERQATVKRASNSDVMKFRIDTPESSGVTPESINAVIEKWSPTSRLKGHGDKILKVANEYGINAAYILGQMMAETSLAKEGVYCAGESDNPYNFGCIKSRSDMPSTPGGYAKPSTIEEGLGLQMSLLRDTYVNEWGLVTVQEVIETYAPANDGNDHGKYYETVGIIMEAAGQDLSETGSKQPGESPDPSSNSNSGGSSSSVDGFMDAFEPIKNPLIQYEENVNKGVEDSNKGVQRKNKSWTDKLFGE